MPSNNAQQPAAQPTDIMHGAALVDAKGKETPITEDMVQQALNNIIKSCQDWFSHRHGKSPCC